MRKHVVYVASAQNIKKAQENLKPFTLEISNDYSIKECYKIKCKALGEMEFYVYFMDQLLDVMPQLRMTPVDILIYDERKRNEDALFAINQMAEDMEALASVWGSDFHFPMQRTIVILDKKDSTKKIFQLGRRQVKDIIINPENLFGIFKSISESYSKEERCSDPKVGLALSGGGMEGCLFQVGCAYALEKALSNKSLVDCHAFSGISSGSIVAAIIANKIPMFEVIRSFYGISKRLPPFSSKLLFDIAGKQIVSRMAAQAISMDGLDPTKWWQKVTRSIPTGFFKGEGLHRFIKNGILEFGGTDRMEDLDSRLFIGGTNQDTFEHITFGKAPWDKISVSDAVRASCALPPFFAPWKINDQYFIDGQITRTCNLELLVQKHCNLIIIIDPLIPYTSHISGETENQGGIHTLIQCIKSLVHTRFKTHLQHLSERYPDVDFLIFQPMDECAQAMSGSPMKLRMNTDIVDLAYRSTLKKLRERYYNYSEKLQKYGFTLATPDTLTHLERAGLNPTLETD